MGNVVIDSGIQTPIPLATTLGLVAENAATNLCRASQTFDNATFWTPVNATVTPNIHAAPDGTLTADTLTATGALGTLTQSITVTAVAHGFALYMKRLVGTGSVALVIDGTVTDVDAQINSSTWTRVFATKTLTAGAKDFSVRVSTLNDAVAIWQADVATGTEPSSPIPTTTVATVRNTDQLEYPVSGNINGSVATIYSECFTTTATTSVERILVAAGGGSAWPQHYKASRVLAVLVPPSSALTVNQLNLSAVNKNASAWDATSQAVCLNGGAVVNGAGGSFATSGNFAVGVNIGGSRSLIGMVRNLKIYAVRLTDVELQTMTAP